MSTNTMRWIDFTMGIYRHALTMNYKCKADEEFVVDFLKSFVSEHSSIVDVCGLSEALDAIYRKNLSYYFNTLMGINQKTFDSISALILQEKTLPGFGIKKENCVVVYPAYIPATKNKREMSFLSIADVYIIEGVEYHHVNAKSNIKDKSGTKLHAVVFKCAMLVAKIWTRGKKPTQTDLKLIVLEICFSVFSEAMSAYKEDVITRLAKANPEMLRFLK